MWRSHSDDYGSPLRSDNLKTITLKEIRIIILNEQAHTLNYFVYVRNRRLRIDNGTGRSAKYTQTGRSVPKHLRWNSSNVIESEIAIEALSWQILLNRIKIVTMCHVEWTLSWEICHCVFVLFFVCFLDKLCPGCIQILANNNRFCSGTVSLLIRNSAQIPMSES